MIRAYSKFPDKLFLIGFSGSGKSTIGPLLAKKLKVRFIETDSLMEKQTRITISELFAKKGERYFRRLESEIIRKLVSTRGHCVIALGGGVFANPANRKLISNAGTTIYLSCSVREIYRRLKNKTDRPLLKGTRTEKLNQIKSLLDRRLVSYQLADIRISTSDWTPVQTTKIIFAKLKESYGYR